MIEYTLSTAQALACTFVLLHNLLAVNAMTSTTPHWARTSAPLLGTLAVYGLVSGLETPNVPTCVASLAVAAYLLAQQRKHHDHPGTIA